MMSVSTFLVGFLVMQVSGFQDEIVNKHNDLRRGINATNMLNMTWSSDASATAQAWADTCSMVHGVSTQRAGCGENLYKSSHPTPWSNITQAWYDEVTSYKYGVGSIDGTKVGHYTQVVWYRSNQIGCAMANCPNASYHYFYVCHYCPAGNVQNTNPYKSGERCDDCLGACDRHLCTNPCLHTDQYSNCPELKVQWGCSNEDIASWCPASCNCTNKIF